MSNWIARISRFFPTKKLWKLQIYFLCLETLSSHFFTLQLKDWWLCKLYCCVHQMNVLKLLLPAMAIKKMCQIKSKETSFIYLSLQSRSIFSLHKYGSKGTCTRQSFLYSNLYIYTFDNQPDRDFWNSPGIFRIQCWENIGGKEKEKACLVCMYVILESSPVCLCFSF